MKIRELIENLKKFDAELEVFVPSDDYCSYWPPLVEYGYVAEGPERSPSGRTCMITKQVDDEKDLRPGHSMPRKAVLLTF